MNKNRSPIICRARNVISSPAREAFASAAKPGRLFRAAFIATVLLAALLILDVQTSQAGSAIWKLNPGNGDWNTATNWLPGTVPNGSADIATFGSSNTATVSLSANAEVSKILFNANASAYTITASPTFSLTMSGEGISNNSGILQNFVAVAGINFGTISFRDSASAGSSTMFRNNGGTSGGASGGLTEFLGTSTAGNAAFTNNGGAVSGAAYGRTEFFDTSTAGNATFTNKGGAANGAGGGLTAFNDSATAGNGAFTNNGSTVNGADGGGTVFNNGATAGNGAFINSGSTVIFGLNPGGHMFFNDSSTAGDGTFTNNGGAASGGHGGFMVFSGNSTAGNATFTNNGSVVSGTGGVIYFYSATAGDGTFTNNGSVVSGADGGSTIFFFSASAGNGAFTNNGSTVSGARGGFTSFSGNATARNASLIANGGSGGGFGGVTSFSENATARDASLIANGGSGGGFGGEILFKGNSTGAGARVAVFGNGRLDISFHNVPGLTVGSIEGDGNIFLGANKLTVFNNTANATFSGVIQDGGHNGGTGGSLATAGFMNLSSANTYTGGTTVHENGRLLVNNSSGSGTGSGPVTVNSSILGGTGTISGPVTINFGATLLGGNATTASGSLKIANNLTLNPASRIQLVLGASGAHSSLTRTGGTWTFNTNQNFAFLDVGAQPGVYDNIITGLAGDPGGESTWSISNEGFTGTFTYDGAGNIDLNLTAADGPALQLISAVSRKTHGGAGTFSLNLPLSGEPGVECRSSDSSDGNHTLRFTFTNNVVSGNASVTTGTGTAGTTTFTGKTMTVALFGVADAQKITVTLSNVRDSFAQILPDKAVSVNMLIGDTTGNKAVNSSDIGQTKSRSGQAATASNFRSDVTLDGTINASDIGLVKSGSGASVP